MKVYIFEISVKFCVDWHTTWYTLDKFKKFLNIEDGLPKKCPGEADFGQNDQILIPQVL